MNARAVSPHDAERHHDRARPGGHLVNTQRETLWKQSQLGGNGRALLVGDDAQQRQIEASEAVDSLDTAGIENRSARPLHVLGVSRVAGDL